MHTPAPWILGDEKNPLIFADGAYVARVMMYSDGETGSLRPTAAANARLIAACPDLVAALQALLPHVPVPRVPMGDDPSNPFPLPDYIAQARAALNKALGE